MTHECESHGQIAFAAVFFRANLAKSPLLLSVMRSISQSGAAIVGRAAICGKSILSTIAASTARRSSGQSTAFLWSCRSVRAEESVRPAGFAGGRATARVADGPRVDRGEHGRVGEGAITRGGGTC